VGAPLLFGTPEPDWFNRQNNVDREYLAGHFDIRTIGPQSALPPITETGHRSHFIHPSIIEDAGGPVAYVLAWIKRAAYAPHWLKIQTLFEQPSFFDDL
jgi:hypothetical protein